MNTLIGKYLFAFFLISTTYYGVRAQLTTVNFEASQDSHIDSRLAITNFGSNSSMAARTYVYSSGRRGGGGGQYYQRSYVKFNLDGIPENAIIYSAELKLTRATSVVGENPFRVKRVTSSWSETLITSSNRPSVSTLSNDICSSYTTSGSVESFDVKDMVQRLVYGQVTDYGWSVEVENEYTGGTSGAVFHSREVGPQFLRPKLVVKYYLPLELSVVTVNHASSITATDGKILFNLSGGASSSYTYSWIDGVTGNVVSSSSSLSGVGYGWYGVHITGDNGEELYQAFLVGVNCEEVEIDFNTSTEYTDNAFLKEGYPYGSQNYANNINFMAGIDNRSRQWLESQSLLRFNLWVDPALVINQADLILTGWYHVSSGGSNAARLAYVTEDWFENSVTWNTKPATNSSLYIPSTTTSAQNHSADIKAYFNNWKNNPSTNRGLCLRLDNGANYYHQQRYHSPTSSSVNSRPVVKFKVSLMDITTPYPCDPDAIPYTVLKEELDGGYSYASNGSIYFSFNERKSINSGNYLPLRIYDDERNLLEEIYLNGTTLNNTVTPIHYVSNNNKVVLDVSGVSGMINGEIYVLEVTTISGEKRYMRFKYKS